MLSVICKDGKFLVKGTFNMGIAGVFENKEYGEGNIGCSYDVKDFERAFERGWELWLGMLEDFADVPHNGDSWAKALEKSFNMYADKVQKNMKQINDYILYQLLNQFMDVEQPFWEIEEAVLPEFAEFDTENVYKDLYENKIWDTINILYKEYEDAPNDGSMQKTDVEALVKKLFPMFNFDGLIATIVPDTLSLGGGLGVQFCDSWGKKIFCHAMVEFNKDLAPVNWDNF